MRVNTPQSLSWLAPWHVKTAATLSHNKVLVKAMYARARRGITEAMEYMLVAHSLTALGPRSPTPVAITFCLGQLQEATLGCTFDMAGCTRCEYVGHIATHV